MAIKNNKKLSLKIKEKIIDMYIIEEIGSLTIGKKLNISKTSVLRILKLNNISRRSISEAGKKLFEKGHIHPMKNKNHTEKSKKKMRGKRPNMISWNKGLTKMDNPNIKGGRISKGPFICKDGYIHIWKNGKNLKYHRWIWEELNGKIPENYVIHHIDGDKLNNNIQNLEMMTMSEHTKRHWDEGKIIPKRMEAIN